mmetsp:Transcript_14598/g.59586  ORF Transcript_14598/g.59586 Transcript_14598/m.59586 type:complete len:171 (+) Transcript_14598:476-988(+)
MQQDAVDCATQVSRLDVASGKPFSSVPFARIRPSHPPPGIPAIFPLRRVRLCISFLSTKIGTSSGFRRQYLLNFLINVYCTFQVGVFPVHKSTFLKLSFLILVPMHSQALEKYNIEKDIAAFIKKEFDKKYNPTWHCIVGRNFGSYVTHETKHFIYFYLGQVAVLLFKSG